MKNMLMNWKTTSAGIATMLPPLADIINMLSGKVGTGSLQMDIAAIIAGVGLIFAKDGNVTGGTKQQ